MNTEKDRLQAAGEASVIEQGPAAPNSGTTEVLTLPGFFTPAQVLERLSSIPQTQPVAALAAANQFQRELTEPFLQAVERGLADPMQDFFKEGMLFNFAVYFLAKWRESRAYPLFVRWFSLPGELAFELGGDTVTHDGARFLASVCGTDREPLKALVCNRDANDHCRGQALLALAVLTGWGERPREELEADLLWLAREGLERQTNAVWSIWALVCLNLEMLAAFPEVRRAYSEGLIDREAMRVEDLDEIERAPRGALAQAFAQRLAPIQDVVQETRWWAGYSRAAAGAVAEPVASGGAVPSEYPYVGGQRVGRNDPCPCGSGKKFKKCCGQ